MSLVKVEFIPGREGFSQLFWKLRREALLSDGPENKNDILNMTSLLFFLFSKSHQ